MGNNYSFPDKASSISRFRGEMMGLAALWIIIFHFYQPILPNAGLISSLEDFIKSIGYFGVELFIFVSGFGCAYALSKENALSFWKKRIKKLAIPVLLLGVVQGIEYKWGIEEFVLNVSGTTFFTRDIYSFIWFVTAIAVFYFFAPFYIILYNRVRSGVIFTFAALIIWSILSFIVQPVLRNDFYGAINRIPAYIIGLMIGLETQKGKYQLTVVARVGLILLFFASGFIIWLTQFNGLILPYSFLYGVCNTCFTVPICILLPETINHLTKWKHIQVLKMIQKVLLFFGSISFEMYGVQRYITSMVPPITRSPAINNVFYFCIVIASGFALCLMVKIITLILNRMKGILCGK